MYIESNRSTFMSIHIFYKLKQINQIRPINNNYKFYKRTYFNVRASQKYIFFILLAKIDLNLIKKCILRI